MPRQLEPLCCFGMSRFINREPLGLTVLAGHHHLPIWTIPSQFRGSSAGLILDVTINPMIGPG